MDLANIRQVKKIALDMRQAIESLPPEELGPCMTEFPRGACGDTSHLLAAYLMDCGFPEFHYVCGERGNSANDTWTSHAWLAKENLVVDITADQFLDAPCGIIVSTSSNWHRTFEIVGKYENADFRVWGGLGTVHLHKIYAKLKPLLVPIND